MSRKIQDKQGNYTAFGLMTGASQCHYVDADNYVMLQYSGVDGCYNVKIIKNGLTTLKSTVDGTLGSFHLARSWYDAACEKF